MAGWWEQRNLEQTSVSSTTLQRQGGAIIEALESVIAEGLNVTQAIVLFDRSGGVVSAAMSSRDIPYQAILMPADLGLES